MLVINIKSSINLGHFFWSCPTTLSFKQNRKKRTTGKDSFIVFSRHPKSSQTHKRRFRDGGMLPAVRRAKFPEFRAYFFNFRDFLGAFATVSGISKKYCAHCQFRNYPGFFFAKVRFRDTKNFSDAWFSAPQSAKTVVDDGTKL